MPTPSYQTLFDQAPVSLMVMDKDMVLVEANEAYCNAVDRNRETLIGRYVFEAFPDTPERVAEVEALFARVLLGETVIQAEQKYELLLASGETVTKVWSIANIPLFDEQGVPSHILQFAQDVTEQAALRERNKVISAELDHRVKNMFAVILSMLNMTGKPDESAEEFKESFEKRLISMGRTHSALSSGSWRGLRLDQIMAEELKQYGYTPKCEHILLSGPKVTLSRRSTETASMVIHELATNASKYGCFSHPEGRLEMSWTVDFEDLRLKTNWREYCDIPITEPTGEGFGTIMLSSMPNAEVTNIWHPNGLECQMSVPIEIALEEFAPTEEIPVRPV